jgi:hypothetical protein
LSLILLGSVIALVEGEVLPIYYITVMKDEKCGTKATGCDTHKDDKKSGSSCSTTKPHEEKKGGCGCGTKK